MSKETYCIPGSPAECYTYQGNAIAMCSSNASAWGIPGEVLTKLAALQAEYATKYAVTSNHVTRDPAATIARDQAWGLLKEALVDLYDHYLLNNTSISPGDRAALNIHITGGGGTPASVPANAPIVSLVTEEASKLHVVYSDPASPGKHYKPVNVAFCELCYKVGDTAPTALTECTSRCNISRSHEAITFTIEQRGYTIYAYARWVNRNGKCGPWSSMVTAIIP